MRKRDDRNRSCDTAPYHRPSSLGYFLKNEQNQNLGSAKQASAQPSIRRPDAVPRRHPDDPADRRGGKAARHRRARPHHRRQGAACEPEGAAADLRALRAPVARIERQRNPGWHRKAAGVHFNREAPDFVCAQSGLRGDAINQPLALDLFSVTAARISVFSASASIFSPSRKSIARRVFPSRLELKRRAGSFSEAPLANVIFTTLL
jgi:hypothetical protein